MYFTPPYCSTSYMLLYFYTKRVWAQSEYTGIPTGVGLVSRSVG